MNFSTKDSSLSLVEDYSLPRRKKSRGKKPRQKWNLLYTIPANILNQSEAPDGVKKGKRLGFSVYDSLVCKLCKPHRFFHTRFSLNTHSESHRRYSSVPPVTTTRVRTRKTRKIDIECIDLDDDSDEDPCEVSIIDGDDEICELIETVQITPDSDEIECLEIDEAEDSTNEHFEVAMDAASYQTLKYQPRVFLKDVFKERQLQIENTPIMEQPRIEEITLDEEEEEVRGNTHIRNLFKEFDALPQGKRKENFEESATKKACLEELLLSEQILTQDVLEVTIGENEDCIDIDDSTDQESFLDDSCIVIC